MQKAVLISIKRQWCNLIRDSKKTIEVRKSAPTLDTPFTCYIYETRGNGGCGAIIGEFLCDEVTSYKVVPSDLLLEHCNYVIDSTQLQNTCLTLSELNNYGYNIKNNTYGTLYGWHISNLIIYEHRRKLCDFYAPGGCLEEYCDTCMWFERGDNCYTDDDCGLPLMGKIHIKPVFKAPQSWQYVMKGEKIFKWIEKTEQ